MSDQEIRARALDAETSFCVTAPAGSGKTELLTQRILRLLARVDRPEQILAITFTRKAAAEMRERVVSALTDAHDDAPISGDHQRVTRSLAKAALKAKWAGAWHLGDPDVFNIRTIDSFCHYLTRQMPLLSGLGGPVVPVDDSQPLYDRALDDLFATAFTHQPTHDALAPLLLNFGNDWSKLRSLLNNLLWRRAEWAHRGVGEQGGEAAKAALLVTVRQLTESLMAGLTERIGQDNLSELADMAAGAARSLRAMAAAGELVSGSLTNPPLSVHLAADVDCLESWRWVARLLLKSPPNRTFRKTVNKNQGFPPSEKDRKANALALLDRFSGDDELEAQLNELRMLPKVSSTDASWRLVLALARLLPLLEAHLLVVFQRQGQVDHTHIALAAESALGDDDAPTDIALRLDYQLEHILIDEFQDTSDSQFRMLEKLTRGWASHNVSGAASRTLFIVGDGMQSIYRFRNANVGLFITARDEGVSGLPLVPLTLKRNFRSQAGLVDWVNQAFSRLLPDTDNPSRGDIKHAPAEPFHPKLPGSAVDMHLFREAEESAEAAWLAAEIGALCRSDPEASIAVLGRTRKSLKAVVTALHEAEIAFVAQEMEHLVRLPVVADLLQLCCVLANPADSLAAVALMRSPLCGLSIGEITHITATSGAVWSLDGVLEQAALSLTDDGAARAKMLHDTLTWAETARDRSRLSVWVEQIWLRLGGAGLYDPPDWDHAKQFFAMLDTQENSGGLDVESLLRVAAGLRGTRIADQGSGEINVEVLTIHKAKGLEFDYVFIPGLFRGPQGIDHELLYWHWYQSLGQRGLLIAADDNSTEGDASLYQYLKHIDRLKHSAELPRLLYVALTRARRKVWLSGETDNLEAWQNKANPFARLADVNAAPVTVHAEEKKSPTVERSSWLLRTKRPFITPLPHKQVTVGSVPELPAACGNQIERSYGTALHRALELLADTEPLPSAHTETIRRAVELILLQTVSDADLRRLLRDKILADVDRMLGDEKGRWLLAPHTVAVSEWALSTSSEGYREMFVDRSFIDTKGWRWIVDYKSSQPSPQQSLDQFLEEEVARYQDQLLQYAAAISAIDAEQGHPELQGTRCALYFPAIAHFQELEPRAGECVAR